MEDVCRVLSYSLPRLWNNAVLSTPMVGILSSSQIVSDGSLKVYEVIEVASTLYVDSLRHEGSSEEGSGGS